jgi:hypothetical protein
MAAARLRGRRHVAARGEHADHDHARRDRRGEQDDPEDAAP